MPQTLASAIARKSLDALLERAEGQRRFSPDEARELLDGSEIAAGTQEAFGRLVEDVLTRGIEVRKLLFFLKESLDVLELSLKVVKRIREHVQTSELSSDEREIAWAHLERWQQQATTRSSEWSALVLRLEAKPRGFDPGILPHDRGEEKAKGFVSLDELSARLISRKDV